MGLKNAGKYTIERLMNQPVPHTRLSYVPKFWIVDIERSIGAVMIALIHEITVQPKNVFLQVALDEIGRMLGGWLKSLKPAEEGKRR